jgi:CubicO group peptidase (beta-lactamase class C family)
MVSLIRAVVLAVFAAALATAAVPASAQGGPRFRVDGPDAEALGHNDGYPTCTGLDYVSQPRCKVGAFSHLDRLFPARAIAAAATPSPLKRAAAEPDLRYGADGQSRTLDDYLESHPVTGLLLARGDTILVERYQYGRRDSQRLTSFSMAKTIVALLIGIAVQEGAIRSINQPAEAYVASLKDTEYGRTPIKALLRMSSGVAFREVYTNLNNPYSDVATLARLTVGQDPGGSLAAVKRFNTRVAPPGESFNYASSETVVLGLVLAAATGRSIAEYARDRLWQKLGAEAEASWIIDATGQEITFAFFNAVLRDWARLGLMLAHDGRWNGQSIVPRDWLLAATTTGPGSPTGYGYQTWLLPGERRMFMLRGLRGQFVLVDPGSKLVLVQTAVGSAGDNLHQAILALWSAIVARSP